MCAGLKMNVPVCCLLFRPVLLGRAPREWIMDVYPSWFNGAEARDSERGTHHAGPRSHARGALEVRKDELAYFYFELFRTG